MIPWHRLFGLTLTDFFLDSAYEVELEKDLSLKQQLLDVVIIEKKQGRRKREKRRKTFRTGWKIWPPTI
jgi:hypothetical protein